MFLKFFTIFLATLCIAIIGANAWGQNAGDYRTKQDGPWEAPSTWERFDGTNWVPAATEPTSGNGQITIRHGVDLNTYVTADQIRVEKEGLLEIDSGGILNILDGPGDDLVVNEGVVAMREGGLFDAEDATTVIFRENSYYLDFGKLREETEFLSQGEVTPSRNLS